MKRAFAQIALFYHYLMSKLDVADLGRWKLPLRIFFLLGIALAVVEAGGWIKERAANSDRSGRSEMEPFTDVTPGKRLFFVARNLDRSANGEEMAMVYDETDGCMLYIRLMPESDLKWVPVSFCDAHGNPTPRAVPVTRTEAKAMWYLHGGGIDPE